MLTCVPRSHPTLQTQAVPSPLAGGCAVVPLPLPAAGPAGRAGSAAEMGPWGPFHFSKHKQTPLSAGSARGPGACGAPASSVSLRWEARGVPKAGQHCWNMGLQRRLGAQILCRSHCQGSPLLLPPGCGPFRSSSSIPIPFPHPCSPLQLHCPFAPSTSIYCLMAAIKQSHRAAGY